MQIFGAWKYTVDRDATMIAYSRAESWGTETCDCAPCRNFRRARADVYPDKFVQLLDSLGIDPLKAVEVYHNARLAPGCHDYAGWFHFIGKLEETGDFPLVPLGDGFTAWMCRANAPRLSTLEDVAVVQLEFHAEKVPWLLDEAEPD